MTFYGPDGEVSLQNGIYLAYDEGRRFVTTDAFTEDFQPAGPFLIGIWENEQQAEGTRYHARARPRSAETRKQHEEIGSVTGRGTCADHSVGLLEQSEEHRTDRLPACRAIHDRHLGERTGGRRHPLNRPRPALERRDHEAS